MGYREFAPQATFTDLGKSMVLRDVTCPCCNDSKDLDLCRDPSVTAPSLQERWQCRQCFAKLDLTRIELRLVDMVQSRSTRQVSSRLGGGDFCAERLGFLPWVISPLSTCRYQLQDLRCSKCHKVQAARQLSLFCPCSGALVLDDPPTEIRDFLQLMAQLADFHHFHWLKEVVQTLKI